MYSESVLLKNDSASRTRTYARPIDPDTVLHTLRATQFQELAPSQFKPVLRACKKQVNASLWNSRCARRSVTIRFILKCCRAAAKNYVTQLKYNRVHVIIARDGEEYVGVACLQMRPLRTWEDVSTLPVPIVLRPDLFDKKKFHRLFKKKKK